MDESEVYAKIEATKLNVKQNKTLRDEFAMSILIGDMASQSEESGFWELDTFDRCAARCYAMADAMMKAREK